MTDEQRPKVSVLMVTYNHEPFIAQAIESVLAQRTSFPMELVIGEDCSKDSTRQIVEKYAASHPEVIRPILHARNVGMHANCRAVHHAARGEFIANLDGDDYWTSPLKLQAGVDILEAHPECSGSYHFVDVVDASGETLHHWPPRDFAQPRLTFDHLLSRNLTPSVSILYRKSYMPQIPAWIDGLQMADWPTLLTLTSRGDFILIDQTLAAYRRHSGGVWSRSSELKIGQAVEEFHVRICRAFPEVERKCGAHYRKGDALHGFRLSDAAGDATLARRYLWRYLSMAPGRLKLPPNQLRAIARTLFPLLRRWLPFSHYIPSTECSPVPAGSPSG
jgi:glycosyltransferase involved in cell wall biosynthesis